MTIPPALVVSIPTPRDRQDDRVLFTIAPVVRALRASPSRGAVWFQRVNKPDWSLRLFVTGEPAWLAGDARAMLASACGVDRGEAWFGAEDPEDKWIGGARERDTLIRFHHADTASCLEALEADAGDALGSRAHFSLRVVEGLLDVLQLHDAERQTFYQRSFQWAVTLGRWDDGVFTALERAFENQRPLLMDVIDAADAEAWPSDDASRIGRSLLHAARSALAGSRADRSDLAVFAAHAHSNRLGIHASHEASLRYLVWRARGGVSTRVT